MKEGWKYCKLSEVCKFFSGFAFKSNKFTEEGMPIIRISDIQNNKIDDSKVVYFNPTDYSQDLSRYIIYPGEILIAMSGGTTGKIGKNETYKQFYLNQRVGAFRENKEILNHDFLYYYLQTKSEESLKIAAGAAQPNLSTSQINNYIIPVPPLSEQQRIVSRLDASFAKIDALTKQAEESVEHAKALFQAKLKELMEKKEGWEEKKIGELFRTYSGGTPLKSQKDYYEGGNIPWLRSGEVCQQYITETEMFITQKGMDNSSAKYFPSNTVVVAMYGATAAQVGILKISATSNQAVCGILPNDNYLSEFVYYWFLYKQKELASQAQGGAQPNISQVKIKNIMIPVITLEEQHQIVQTLDSLSQKIQQLQQNYNQTLANCQALKQALLKETFE